MSRASITLTESNSKWLKAQVEAKEYSSQTEAINALIRDQRKFEETRREALIAALAIGEEGEAREWSRKDLMIHLRHRAGLDKAA